MIEDLSVWVGLVCVMVSNKCGGSCFDPNNLCVLYSHRKDMRPQLVASIHSHFHPRLDQTVFVCILHAVLRTRPPPPHVKHGLVVVAPRNRRLSAKDTNSR